jgi:pyruvate dehydrogenase E2 component (dihydrolipoyllysine-residue acetyltransferase)
MAYNIVMPALEMAQESGKLLSWRKKEGERVAKGDPLLDVETDKAVVEIEAPASGILAGVTAREGDVLSVGVTIGWIVAPGEKPPAVASPPAAGRQPPARPAKDSSPAVKAGRRAARSEGRASPKARRLAREHGIDLSSVRGSGPGREILAEDIQALVGSAAAPAANNALGAVARLMAERTAASWRTVPHFFLVREVDAGGLLVAREQRGPEVEKACGVRLTHTDLLVALAARVLPKHPRLNASWDGGAIRLNKEVNVGIAVAVEQGVVAPVIPRADGKDLAAIAALRAELTERARANRLRPSDIAGATFTISNLGMYDVDAFSAIINPPQAAILAVGRIADRVVPVDGQPGVRPTMTITMSCDHRVVDGVRAAEFLQDLAGALAAPGKWIP